MENLLLEDAARAAEVQVSPDVDLNDASGDLEAVSPAPAEEDALSDGTETIVTTFSASPSDNEKSVKRRFHLRFLPRPRPSIDVWDGLSDTLSQCNDPADSEATGATSSQAYERWRRKSHDKRNDLWSKIRGRFERNRAEWDRLTTAIRQGVPTTLRGAVWYNCSGAATKKQESDQSYWDLVASGLELKNEAKAVIEIDVPRTGIAGPQRGPLRNVLLAFAAKNPEIGYCQSMNFITAALLVYNEEERAFWMLCSLIEDLLPAEYYTSTMSGLRRDLRLMESLIKAYLPRLRKHLVDKGIDLSPIAMNWFLCLFVNTLPAETSHRVLDCLFHEGPKVLFRAALALLKMKEPGLLKTGAVVDAYMILRAPLGYGDGGEAGDGTPRLGTQAPGLHAGSDTISCSGQSSAEQEDLLGYMYGLWLKGLSNDALDHMRQEQVKAIEAEDAANEARRASRGAEAASAAEAACTPPADDASLQDVPDGTAACTPPADDSSFQEDVVLQYDENYFDSSKPSDDLEPL